MVFTLIVSTKNVPNYYPQLYFRALPGRRRGAGLGDTFNGSTSQIGGFLGKPRSAGISTDPAVGRRIDGLENKIQGTVYKLGH